MLYVTRVTSFFGNLAMVLIMLYVVDSLKRTGSRMSFVFGNQAMLISLYVSDSLKRDDS